MEKDVEKAKRLNEVYKYLYSQSKVKSQTDFADKLHIQRSGLSAAMNGAKANLTKNLFQKICAAFPGVFSLDYLLTGDGQLLTNQEEVKHSDQPTEDIPMWADTMISIIAKQIKENETLHRELKQSILEFNAARVELEKILYKLSNSSSSAASYGNPKEPSSDGNLAAENNHPFPQK